MSTASELIPNLPEEAAPQDVKVADLVDALINIFARWSCQAKAVNPDKDKHGVHVWYNTAHRNLIKFEFRTVDDIGVQIVFDVEQASQSYVRNMVDRLQEYLREKRANNRVVSRLANEAVDQHFQAINSRLH